MTEKTRIMYIERKGDDGLVGDARIGKVIVLNKGKQLRYQNQKFSTLRGAGFKSNYYDVETRQHYWISGCRKDGRDALYSTTAEIDEDIREEYWTEIRSKPEMKQVASIKVLSKY